MRSFIIILLFSLTAGAYDNGDLIFIKSQTSQSQALRDATGSEWTHVGIIYDNLVYEAIGGVKSTSVAKFVARSKNKEFVVKRFEAIDHDKDKELLDNIMRFKSAAYDIYFEWSDDRIYCSELVYKVFNLTYGVGVGELQTFNDMNLDAPSVKALIKARYKNGHKFDPSEIIVTPVSVLNDENLETVE